MIPPDQMTDITNAGPLTAKKAWSMTCEAEIDRVKDELAAIEDEIYRACLTAREDTVWHGPALSWSKLATIRRLLRSRGFVVDIEEGEESCRVEIGWEQR